MRLDGKVAIVTGAGSGIGRAAARLFGAAGARVVVAERDAGAGAETVAAVAAAGGSALLVETDVRVAAEVRRLVERSEEAFGRLDVLFNNAGVEIDGPVDRLEEEAWDTVIDTNLKGVYLCSRFAVPALRRAGGGAIVNIASVLAQASLPGCTAYAASKAGVVALTRTMALDYARENIRVNCLLAGSTDTPLMWQAVPPGGMDEARRMAAEATPMGYVADPTEVAAVALYLASDQARFVTGAAIAVDGGLLARLAASL
jgi:NAD(P)-dependent dehydrogenase (short-subunit alcohol dehydrogenase family)